MNALTLGTLHATAWWHILRALALSLRAAVARRHGRAARSTLHELDDRMLADIGLARSEIDSVEAEAQGLAPRTRRRIVARNAG